MNNPNYTRDITPEYSDRESLLEVEDDDYQSPEYTTTDNDKDLDDESFERKLSRKELQELYKQPADSFYKSSEHETTDEEDSDYTIQRSTNT